MKPTDRTCRLRAYWRGVRLLSSYMPRFFAAITWHSLVDAASPYLMIVLLSRFLGAWLDGADVRTLWAWGGAAVLTQVLLMTVSGLLRRFKEAKWEHLYRVADRIVIDQCLTLDHAALDDTHTRSLLATVRENTKALGKGLVSIPEIYQNLCLGLFGTVGAVVTTWGLFASSSTGDIRFDSPLGAVGLLACLAALTVTSWGLSYAAQRARCRHTSTVVALDRLYYTMMDVIFDPSKAADLRLYRQDERLVGQLEEVDDAFFSVHGIKRPSKATLLSMLSAAVKAVWFAVVTGFVGTKAFVGIFTLGATVQYIGALLVWMQHLERLCRGAEAFGTNAAYVETVLRCLELSPQLYRGSLTTEKRTDGEYEWEFRHVTFRYPGQSEAALKDVSVTLRAGSRTAIVGENGSGKSTFVKLLCRLYDPDEGEILLNGIDIRKYNYEQYIALVSVVFQDFCLLPQPLGDNVAASAVYDAPRVERCLADAGAATDDLQALLYRSAFGDGMIPTLGEAQKIAIARALYKDAPLMILDEPTAALDPVAEAAIYRRFDRMVNRRTAVYVSHRLASCHFCRDILVFDHGRLVERGTHTELVSLPAGKYRALWESGSAYYQ